MLSIVAGMDQKRRDTGLAHRRLWQWHGHGWFCWFRAVPLGCRQAQDALHRGRYGPEGQL